VKSLVAVVGIVAGILLGVAGVALGAVGLMAMGAETPKAVVVFGGLLLVVAAVAVIGYSAVGLWRLRSWERA
jgi:hypothetical protein